jgi:hypothetical protein
MQTTAELLILFPGAFDSGNNFFLYDFNNYISLYSVSFIAVSGDSFPFNHAYLMATDRLISWSTLTLYDR